MEGTYAEVFRGFHPAGVGGDFYINHAHNDFAEWLMEGGVLAAALIVVLGALYLGQWRRVWRVRKWQTFQMMQAGAGVGLFLLVLHGLTDYNLRIPANALYFAFLAGLFFHPGENGDVRRRRGARDSEADSLQVVVSPPASEAASAMVPLTHRLPSSSNDGAWVDLRNEPSVGTVRGDDSPPATPAGQPRNPFDE